MARAETIFPARQIAGGHTIRDLTICEEIGSWAAGLSLGQVPASVVERARLQQANMLAAREAGTEAAAPFAAVAPDGPLGDVYAGAAASIAHDWDDYLFMGHTCHSAVWAAQAFADAPDRALIGQIAANEVGGRLGAALFLGPHNGQFWASIHCASAAVAAGIGIGLDSERLAHAVAIALYQPPYGLWPGFMGPNSKLLTAAEPATQGARAALLAAEGVDGALDVIESSRGLLAHFSFAPRPSMLGELGRVWLTDTLAFKPVPGCAYLQEATEAIIEAGIDSREIAAIDVDAGYLTCAMEELGRGPDLTPVRVNFSLALSLAVALLAGRLTHEELRPAWLQAHEPEIRELAARVRVRHDWGLTLETARGVVDAGVSTGDVPLRGWARARRRMRELDMDELSIGWAGVRELARQPEARELIRNAIRDRRYGAEGGLAALDTSLMRLEFPCRLRLSRRSGHEIELAGKARGGCGRPPAEQRAVVEEKCARVGVPLAA